MDLQALDLKDLTILVMMYDGDNISEVAVKLKISQPAVSQRLKKIKSALGFDVVKKSGSSKAMTENGLALASASRIALATLQKGLPNDGSRPAPICA